MARSRPMMQLAEPAPPLARHFEIAEGLNWAVLQDLLDRGLIAVDEAEALIAPRRTLMRRKRSGRFTSGESDRLARVLDILRLAERTFGESAKAHRWLRAPNGVTGGHRPLDLCSTGEGGRLVETVLGRLAHGVYA
ncbi:MAG: DUF2384 domain-containing protein [Rhodospirillaceae bacterium]|nr:DUF2384 domain-containing protein [Rhodospirillaceae bacterium]